MKCRHCRYWLRDLSFPDGVGFCSAKGAVVNCDDACEMYRRREEESVAVRVLSY